MGFVDRMVRDRPEEELRHLSQASKAINVNRPIFVLVLG
jgi:hypothetical protein